MKVVTRMQSNGNSRPPVEPEPYLEWVREFFPLLESGSHQLVVQEMERLVEIAGFDTDQSATAREFLGHLVITRGGAPRGIEQHYVSHMAARALMRLSYNEELRDQVFPSLRMALAYCPMLPADMRLIMLDGLEAMAHDKYWREDHLKELGDLLLRSLRLEFERQPRDRDERYQMRLLFLMKMAGNVEAEPLFDAIADSHDSDEIRQLSKQVSRHVFNSLEYVWANTPEDQVSSTENRAARLREAPTLQLNESELVQAMFNQLKGADLLDDSDPRIAPLEEAMYSDQPRVRLAAAFGVAVILRGDDVMPAAKRAINLLADFAVNCDRPSDISDALFALKRARAASASVAREIDAAKRAASEAFVQRSMHE